jgi:hypothetical protein
MIESEMDLRGTKFLKKYFGLAIKLHKNKCFSNCIKDKSATTKW